MKGFDQMVPWSRQQICYWLAAIFLVGSLSALRPSIRASFATNDEASSSKRPGVVYRRRSQLPLKATISPVDQNLLAGEIESSVETKVTSEEVPRNDFRYEVERLSASSTLGEQSVGDEFDQVKPAVWLSPNIETF